MLPIGDALIMLKASTDLSKKKKKSHKKTVFFLTIAVKFGFKSKSFA